MAAEAGLSPGVALLARGGLFPIAKFSVLPFNRPTYPSVFPEAGITWEPPLFTLILPIPGGGGKVISFEERVNEIVRRWGEANEAQVREIHIALREYEQRVFVDIGILKQKILSIVERTLPPRDQVLPVAGGRRGVSLDRIDDLFRAGSRAREKANNHFINILVHVCDLVVQIFLIEDQFSRSKQ
jgi:hypothetical protein